MEHSFFLSRTASTHLNTHFLDHSVKYYVQMCYQMSDFKAKMHQIRFRLGFRPRPHGGAYTALPQGP